MGASRPQRSERKGGHMSAAGNYRNPIDYKLIRAVGGRLRSPDDLDVDEAIDASSTRSTLSELSQRGYSAVSVLDRRKIAKLIHDAVGEAIENRTSAVIQAERQKI